MIYSSKYYEYQKHVHGLLVCTAVGKRKLEIFAISQVFSAQFADTLITHRGDSLIYFIMAALWGTMCQVEQPVLFPGSLDLFLFTGMDDPLDVK